MSWGPSPSVSLEAMVAPAPLHVGEGVEHQEGGDVAAGDGISLQVWADDRAHLWLETPTGISLDRPEARDIFAVRYASDGSLLDEVPILVSSRWQDDSAPTVAYGGGVFFVAWVSGPASGERSLRGARVSVDGELLDPHGIDLTSGGGPPAISFLDGHFYIGHERGIDAAVMAVSVDGEVVTPPVVVSAACHSPSLGHDGQHLLVGCWVPGRTTLVDTDLTVLASQAGGGTAVPSALAGGPGGFLAFWAADGFRIDSSGQTVQQLPGNDAKDVCRDDDGYFVVGNDLRFLADSANTLTEPLPFGTDFPTGIGRGAHLACEGGQRTVGWTQEPDELPGQEVRSAPFDAGGLPLLAEPRRAPRSTTAQVHPAVATIGGATFVAFNEVSRTRETVRFGFMGAVSTLDESSQILGARDPVVVQHGDRSTMIWWTVSPARWFGAEIHSDGTLGAEQLLLEMSFELTDDSTIRGWSAAAAADRVMLTVAYEDDGLDDWVELRVFDDDLSPKGQTSIAGVVAVPAAEGSMTVLALSESEPVTPGPVAAVCLPDEVFDGVAAVPVVLGQMAAHDPPAAASDGSHALIVWTDEASRQVHGALIDQTCTPTTELTFTESAGGVSAPNLVFDGEVYLLTWRELGASEADLFAMRVSTSGEIIDAAPFVISAEPGNESRPALAPDGALVAYSRFDPASQASRVFVRQLTAP